MLYNNECKKKMKNENDVAGSICATKWKERKEKEWKMDYARQVEYIVITLMKRIN